MDISISDFLNLRKAEDEAREMLRWMVRHHVNRDSIRVCRLCLKNAMRTRRYIKQFSTSDAQLALDMYSRHIHNFYEAADKYCALVKPMPRP